MASIRRKNTRWRVMPYAYGDYILTCGEITYQSFGLDKKRTKRLIRSFFGKRLRKRYFCRTLIRFRTPTEATDISFSFKHAKDNC